MHNKNSGLLLHLMDSGCLPCQPICLPTAACTISQAKQAIHKTTVSVGNNHHSWLDTVIELIEWGKRIASSSLFKTIEYYHIQ